MEINKKIIICDTNIWYHIASGKIRKVDILGKNLIGTFVSASELCSSFNAVNNYQHLRDAVFCFNQKTNGLCIEEPVEYIKAISGHRFNSDKWKEREMAMNGIMQFDKLTDEMKQIAQVALQEYADKLERTNQGFIDLIFQHRDKISNHGEYKRRMKTTQVREYHLEITKEVISTLIEEKYIDWKQIELFVLTFDEWLWQLSVQPTLKMTPNDWDDVLNLIYVQPGSYYWTLDERKTKIFIRLCGCGDYLFDN